MQAVTGAWFSDREREVFERARLAVWVAFPKPYGPDGSFDRKERQGTVDGQAHSMMTRLSEHAEVFSFNDLIKAKEILEKIVLVCGQEKKREHWDSMVTKVPAEPGTSQVGNLIYDVDAVVNLLVGARSQFYRDACEALFLIHEATLVATPMPVREKFMEGEVLVG